jgi:hypothetical protein
MLWLYKAKDDAMLWWWVTLEHQLTVARFLPSFLSASTLLSRQIPAQLGFLTVCISSSVRCWLLQPITTRDSYAAGCVNILYCLRSVGRSSWVIDRVTSCVFNFLGEWY